MRILISIVVSMALSANESRAADLSTMPREQRIAVVTGGMRAASSGFEPWNQLLAAAQGGKP